MSMWVSVLLGELVEVKGGKRLPLGHKLQIEKNSAPYIRIVDFDGGIIDQSKMLYVPTQTQPLIQRYRVARGDVFISIVGTVGVVGVIPKSLDGAFLTENAAKLTSFEPVLNSSYLSYALRSSDGQNSIREQTVGSTQPKLALHRIREISIPLPPIDVQRAIAEVLGALDDKIAANTKLSSTIEQLLAMEVDVEWLINLQEAELISILEMFEVNPPTSKPTEAVPLYLEMKKLPETGSGVSEWDYRPARGGTRFKQGDSLMARITPCLENRKTGFVDFLKVGEVGIGSTEFIALRAHEGIPNELSYFLAINTEFRDFAIRHMVGTSGRQRVSASDVATYLVPTPNDVWLQDFAARIETQFKFTKSLRQENRTLAATRDALLPQLMSGKLRVRDAETAVEAVV